MKLLDAITRKFSQITHTGEKRERPTIQQIRRSIWVSGTKIANGYIMEEYNRLFAGRRAYQTYDEMYRSDSTIWVVMACIQDPIRSADRFIKPHMQEDGSITPQDQEVYEFVKHARNKMDKSRQETLPEILHMVRDWVSVFEKIRKIKDGKVLPVKLDVRRPWTIERRETEDNKPGITQDVSYGDAVNNSLVSIPDRKLVIFTFRKEWENYEWHSLLRQVGKNYIMKKDLENYEMMWYEAQFRWVKQVSVPANASTEEKKAYLEQVASYEIWNDNILIAPEWYSFEFVNMEIKQAWDIAKAIQRHDNKIKDSSLAFFIKLWESERWSFGMAESNLWFFILWLESICNDICHIINKHFIKDIVDYNFDWVENYPTLWYWEIWTIDKNELSASIERLTKAWHLTPDKKLEQYVRDVYNLPTKMEEESDGGDATKIPSTPSPDKPEDDADNTWDGIQATDKQCCSKKGIFDDIIRPDKIIAMTKKKDKQWLQFNQKKKFQEKIKTSRPLTFAEQKVNIPQMTERMQKLEDNIEKDVRERFAKTEKEIKEKVVELVNNNDIQWLAQLSTQYESELREIIITARQEAFDYWKDSVAWEIWANAVSTTTQQRAWMETEADLMSSRIVSSVVWSAQQAVSQEIARNAWEISTLSSSIAIRTISDSIQKNMDKVISSLISTTVTGTINTWRGVMFEAYSADLYAYQYSAILDNRTTMRCMSLDGRVVKAWSMEYSQYSPPQHYRCRSIRVGILIDETFKPPITGIPSSIPAVTNIAVAQDLKSPQILKNSPAKKIIQDEIDQREKKIKEYEESGTYPNRIAQHKKRIEQLKRWL